jgi:hypothetical protein
MEAELILPKKLEGEYESGRLMRVLRHARRRAVLSHLATEPSSAEIRSGKTYTLEELTDAVAAVETSDETRTPEKIQTEIRISLHHQHLPHLDDCGLLDYEFGDNTVRYHGHPLVEEFW